MTNSIETTEKYIELFVLLNQEYISSCIRSELLCKCDNHRKIFFMGWKTIIHLFKLTRHMHLKMKETYNVIKKSITIYIEYTEQVVNTESEYDNNNDSIDFGKIFTFIHKKAFENQSLTGSISLTKISETEVLQMINTTETLLLWNDKNFTLENRLHICNQFLQSYILLLNNDSLIYYGNVLNFLLEKMNESELDEYTSFLTEFYLFVSRRKKQPLTESITNSIYLNKYYSQIEEFDNMVSNRKKKKNSKAFIKWFFC